MILHSSNGSKKERKMMIKSISITLLFLVAFAAALLTGGGNVYSQSCSPEDQLRMRCVESDYYVITADDMGTDASGNPVPVEWPTYNSDGTKSYTYTITAKSSKPSSVTLSDIKLSLDICPPATSVDYIAGPAATVSPAPPPLTQLQQVFDFSCTTDKSGNVTCPGSSGDYQLTLTAYQTKAGTQCRDVMQVVDGSVNSTGGLIKGPGCPSGAANITSNLFYTPGNSATIDVVYDACDQNLADSVVDVANPKVQLTQTSPVYICVQDGTQSTCTPTSNSCPCYQVLSFSGSNGTSNGTLVTLANGEIFFIIGNTAYHEQ
jgi:hypothetical protein